MLCLTKKHIITYMFFFFCFAFVFVLYSPGVNAIEDVTGSVSSSTPNYTSLCDNNDQNKPNCSDYTYIIFESSDNLPNSSYWMLDLEPTNANAQIQFLPFIVFNIHSQSSVWFRFPSALGSIVYNYTLTNSLGSGCPEPEPCPSCPVCPVVPENPYDEKFDDIKHAIYIGIASLFVIYFFYCIYRMIIKGVK